jgi:predicted RNase H-related nuclease YkuK (DUF458 family)
LGAVKLRYTAVAFAYLSVTVTCYPAVSEETSIPQQSQTTAAMLEHAVSKREPSSVQSNIGPDDDGVASSLVFLKSA